MWTNRISMAVQLEFELVHKLLLTIWVQFIIKTNCISVSCQNCLSINTFWIFVAKFWCIYEYLLTVCTLESDEYVNLFIFSKKKKYMTINQKNASVYFFKGNVSSWIFFYLGRVFFIIIFHIILIFKCCSIFSFEFNK